MNKIGKSFIVIGVLLVITSFLLLFQNNYEEVEAGRRSKDIVVSLKNNFSNIKKVTVEDSEVMSTINIDNYNYIGILTIPTLNLELPVMSEYSEDLLKIAPVRYYGSIYTDDLVICAHSYRTHFKYLNQLKQNDTIIFTDIDGNNYIYEVLEIEILDSTDVLEMLDSDFDLTLYTCTSDGFNRITVRCNKVKDNI